MTGRRIIKSAIQIHPPLPSTHGGESRSGAIWECVKTRVRDQTKALRGTKQVLDVYLAKKLRNIKKTTQRGVQGGRDTLCHPHHSGGASPRQSDLGFVSSRRWEASCPGRQGFRGWLRTQPGSPQHPPEHPKARRGQGNPDGRHPASSILLKAGKKKNHTADLPNSLPAPRGEQGANTSSFLVF